MTYSSPESINTTVNMFTWINSVTGNYFFPGTILAVFVIVLVKMLTVPENTASKSFAAASFVIMILSVLARMMNFVSTGFMTLFIIFTAIGGVWMHIENAST